MFGDFCRHRLTIEADVAVCRAKAVPSFLSYFMTLSIGSVLNPRPPALQSSALPAELILYTNKWALRVYSCTISVKYYEIEEFLTIFQVIYQTWDAVFHHQMKHREESWKYDAQRSIFDELRGVSSGDETLCRMFDISSQTKSFLKEKLRMQILSSVSSDFQTLIKH